MTPDGTHNISDMLRQISENPAAKEMLTSLLGGMATQAEPSDTGNAPSDASSNDEEDAVPVSLRIPPASRGHARGRREMLNALRPYLGSRRAASVDRMIRALELYEIIEETRLLKGGNT